jgi:hypothetical protein
VSRINGKLGLRAAGKRNMMKLPTNRAEAARITAAVCPACGRRGANASKVVPGALFCTWCTKTWIDLTAPQALDAGEV